MTAQEGQTGEPRHSPGLPGLTLAVEPETGVLFGKFIMPGTSAIGRVGGVVIQKQNAAFGFFQGPAQAGVFSLTGG